MLWILVKHQLTQPTSQSFALTKELMIQFPDKFGSDKYFRLFWFLHIEKLLLIIWGQVIKGSGLDVIMCTYGLPIVGVILSWQLTK